MQVKTTYVGLNSDGIKGIWCGFKPENISIINEQNILYPKVGMVLKHKVTEKLYQYVMLRDTDSIDYYEEIEESRQYDKH